MNEPDPQPHAVDSTIEDEIGVILERYLQQQERGEAVSREDLLAQYPQFAERLAACLDGVALFGAGGSASQRGSADSYLPKVPESIGDFEILRELGRGGMGVVYEAREKSLDRIVAVKVMRFGVVDPRALERFQREAETAGALHHTNIVPVYATGREADTSWYAMQRIDGESLADRIRRAYHNGEDAIPVEEILQVGIQAAEALDHAHQRDVIHRDVKPANLIVDREERVWLTDFGLARRLVDVGATMTGAIMGTPRYMSPEQANLRRVEVDHRTDIYSLGATLYEMATGRPPFESDDPLKVIGQIRYDEPPSPRSLRPRLPRDLDVVLSKCLEKEAQRRYASAGELADDLRAIRDDRAIRARAVSILERAARWTRKHQSRVRVAGITGLATATAILLSIIGWQSWQASSLGSFRLRAAGGPYMTSIHPVGESSLSKSAVELTVPMQQHEQLPIGDYDMLLAPRGRWSQKLRLPVSGGLPTEYRLASRPSQSKEISIEGACAAPVAGFHEPAVLLSRDGSMQRISLSGDGDWSLFVRQIESTRTILPGVDASSDDSDLKINFANTAPLVGFFRSRAMLADGQQLSSPQMALRTPIDLDGDGDADSLIAATDKSALLAVSSYGRVLWARGYDLNGISLDGNPSQPPQTGSNIAFPGILDLIDVGDRDGDGIHDVASLMMHIRPGIQNDVCITTLSGKTGEPLQAIHPLTLQVADSSQWPQDGVLRVHDKDTRRRGALTFTAASVHRSFSGLTKRVIWSGGRQQTPTFAMPSPLQIVALGQRLVAIYHAGTECRRFDLDSGEEIGAAITLPFTPATGAGIARLNADSLAIIFHERESRTQQTSQGTREVLRVVAYGLDGSLLWERLIEHVNWQELAWLRNKGDWPLAGDVNGDGRDELVLPTSRYHSGEEIGIEMLDPADGSPIWKTAGPRHQIFGTAEECLHRIALSSDINGDGWREWVTATTAGPPSPLDDRRTTAKVGEAYVYVDWISGKTGARIAWARHLIPIVSDAMEVAEIDAIRCDVPGGDTGSVEVDFVTGDNDQDTQLESMVLRFHPSSPDAIGIAAGLDVCSLPMRGLEEQATRVYHMRPGPYFEGPNRLVLLAEESDQMLRLGEGQRLATWKSAAGRQLVAVQGFEPPRLSVVDAGTLETVWSTNRENSRSSRFVPVKDGDGRTDFLVQWKSGQQEELPILIDGDSGLVRWTLDAEPGGGIKDARPVSKKWLLIVGDGRITRRANLARPPDAFKMSLVSSATGKVRWSTYFLHGAPRHNHPSEFHDLQIADVNGDGWPDVIGPEQQQGNQRLLIAAWDGATGERLWTRRLFRTGPRTNYFVPFCVVPARDRPVVAYIGPESEKDVRGDASLIVCDAATGDALIISPLDDSKRVQYLKRDTIYTKLALANCSPSPGQPRVGLLHYADASRTPRWTLFDVQSDSFSEVMSWQRPREPGSNGAGVWLRDVTGDAVPERFVATKLPSIMSRREDGSIFRREQQVLLSRYEVEAEEPTWEVGIPTSFVPHITWRDDASCPTACLQVSPNGFTCVDLTAGKVLATFADPSFDRDNLPLVTATRQHESGNAIRVASPSRDGLVARWLGDVRDRPSLAALHSRAPIHSEFDPRRVKRLMAHVGAPNGLAQMLVDAARALASLTTLVIIPLAYLGSMLRRRQWSLSWLMLAPPIVLLSLIVWNTSWAHEPSLFVNLLSGSGWLLSGAAIIVALREREPDDLLRGKSWMVVVFGTLLAFVATFTGEFSQATDPTIRYVFAWQDAVQLFITSICATGYMYWLLRLCHGMIRWFGKRQAERRTELVPLRKQSETEQVPSCD